MFSGLDDIVRSLLRDSKAPAELRGAQANFVTPDKGYAPAENTVNLFLYDVKENRDLRDPVPIIKKGGAEFIRRRPPLRVDCSYLVTAWSTAEKDVKVKEEHQLLGQAFLWLSRFPTIPEKFLQGTLADQPFPPPTMVAQMDGTRNTAEFWTALGISHRPCFNLVVTIAMELGVGEPEGKPVASKEIRLVGADSLFQIGGAVRDAASRAPLEAVELTLVELGEKAETKKDGHYTFFGLAQGDYRLMASKDGYEAQVKVVRVPGATLTAFDIELTTDT